MILNDGFSTTIGFAAAPSVLFKEKTVTPPAIDGGGEIDTTTMHNIAWRTRQPRQLKTLTEASGTSAYDPAVYDDILTLVNNNNLITVTFPDGSTLAFWGYLNEFSPGELSEGEQPEADFTIICTNQDNSGAETPPLYTPGTPTTTTA